LEKTIGQRLKKKQIGFRQGGAVQKQASQKQASQKQASPTKTAAPGAPAIKSSKIMDRYQKIVQEAQERDSLLEKMTSDDLQKFGLIPEFIGRMPIRTALKGLTEADLIKILVEPKNAIVPQFIALFKLDNVELVINDEALLEIARMALVQKTGARGLRSILENLLLDAMYDAPDSNVIKVEVTAESVRDGAPLKYTYEQEEEIEAVSEAVYTAQSSMSA